MSTNLSIAANEPARSLVNIARTVGYFAAFLALGLYAAVLGPTLPDLAASTHTSLSLVSVLFTTRSLGYLLGSLGGGRIYDRFPGHPIMVAMAILMGITFALVPVLHQIWLLAVILLLAGIGEGSLDIGGNLLLAWIYRQRVGPYMNAMHFFFGVGAFLAPVVVAQVVRWTNGYAWSYWILALFVIPLVIWIGRLPSPAPQLLGKHEVDGRVDWLLIGLMVLFFIVYVGAEAGFGGWVYSYTIRLNLANEQLAAYLTSGFWGALTLGRLLAVPLATRFSPGTMLYLDIAGCIVAITLVLLWPASLIALWVGAILLGLFMASMFPSMLVLASRWMTVTGRVNRWFFVGGGAGGMLLPWLIGQLFERFGPRLAMWSIFVDLLFLLIILTGIAWRHQAQSRILQSRAV